MAFMMNRLMVCFALLFTLASCHLPATDSGTTVTRVIDGDTIEVSIRGVIEKVRYIGIDTPEIGKPFFEESTEANRRMVEDKTVTLVQDVSERDRYGRLLRYVYVGELFVNAELLHQGYAQVATYPPDVKYINFFLQLQREAREAGRGLWSLSSVP
jgi:micrococcal nuclease